MSTPKFLKKKGDPDSIYHAYTVGLASRDDMEPFEPPVIKSGKEPEPGDESSDISGDDNSPLTEDERLVKIRTAVLSVPVEEYGKAGFGRPTMPKVKTISALVGFEVSADEIVAVMKEAEAPTGE